MIAAAAVALDHLNQHSAGRWEFVRDLSGDERFTVPIVLEDGTLAATLRLRSPDGSEPARAERDEVRSFAHLLAALISTEQEARRARTAATEASADALSDHLTGLSNRRAWQRALSREALRCERRRIVAAIAVIDLDDLKEINDREGHLAGDLMIKHAADTIATVVRGGDLVARLGGDEFGVLAVDWEEPSPATLVLRLRRGLSQRGVVASVGAALHQPGADIARTFHEADMEMYEAKRVRKGVRTGDAD